MNETLCFQVRHAGRYLCGHVEQHGRAEFVAVAIAQIVQQISSIHELCYDVERRLSGAYTYTEQTN